MELPSEKTAIIDADSISFIAHWDSDNKTFNKPLEDILKSVDQIISNILINTKADKYIGLLGLTSSELRKKVYADYKSNRKDREPLEFIKNIREHMLNVWQFYPLYGVESDDVACSLNLVIPNSFICSVDKDLLNLEGTHWNYKKNEWVTTSKDEANSYFWRSMVTGDSVDNIKGLEGKGAKFFERLIDKHKELDNNILRDIIFNAYVDHYGEYKGIEKFYQNYMCLKMIEGYQTESFEPIVVNVNNLVI
jgi:5'-3' exonuclease